MNCKDCKHCDTVPGSAHKSCNAGGKDNKAELTLMIGLGYKITATVNDVKIPAITFNQHGVDNGWCTWPMNFDPVWIDSCMFYNDKNEEDNEK